MTIRPLVILPDARLRRPCEPVAEITDDIRALARDMLETMYDASGVGLAASQIGVLKRVITIDLSKAAEQRHSLSLLNTEIFWASEEPRVYEEGSLSIPEYYAEVE